MTNIRIWLYMALANTRVWLYMALTNIRIWQVEIFVITLMYKLLYPGRVSINRLLRSSTFNPEP